MGTQARHVYQFGAFRLDPANRLLYRDGEVIALPPKVFDTLLLLVTNSGQLLSKDEMMKRLWPDTFVEEGTLAQYVFLLRKALGNSATWIENHPRRGYRFTAPVQERDGELRIDEHSRSGPVIEVEAVTGQGRVGKSRTVAAALAIALLAMLAAIVWVNRTEKASRAIGSVAVLPFRTVSNSSDDYRADGITDALITKLANLKGLRVVSYSRVRQFKGSSADAAEIGRKLGVEAVIEGTVRVASGQIRLSVHAVETETADTLWADDRFETNSAGQLNIERQLAEVVALRLRGHLTSRERGLLTKSGARNAEAYDLVLRARVMVREGRIAPAVQILERAVQLDPGFAEAYGWLAFVQHRSYTSGLAGPETLRSAISNATQALSRDPNSFVAMRALVHIQHSTGREVEGLLMARRALESHPDDLDATAAAAEAYFRTGLYDRAIPLFERVLAGESENREFRTQLARMYLFLGEYKKGIEVISPLPLSQVGPFGLFLYAETGQMHKVIEAVRSAPKNYAEPSFNSYVAGCLLAEAGDLIGAKEIWIEAARRGESLLKRPHGSLGRLYAKLGKREQALDHVRQMLAPDPRHPVHLFFASETFALLGHRREALDSLRAAMENGFFNLPMIDGMARLGSGSLHSLRNDREFLTFRADLARRVEQLRARY